MNLKNIDELETLYVASADERIRGWYVVEAGIDPPHKWIFNDRGNGPDVIKDGVFGPFESEDATNKYLADYLFDLHAMDL